MQIYGDVLLVQQTKEAAFKPRERHINFTKQQFDEAFTKKRKRAQDTTGLTQAEFESMKKQMATSLDGLEASMSSSAVRPQDLAMAAVMPASTGSELKTVARMMGHVPPQKLALLEQRLTEPVTVA